MSLERSVDNDARDRSIFGRRGLVVRGIWRRIRKGWDREE